MKLENLKYHNTNAVKAFLLALIAATLLFQVNYGNLSIIIAIIYNLVYAKKENLHKARSFAFVFPLLFLIISIVSSLLSRNHIKGLMHTDLELLPLLLVIILINHKDLKKGSNKVFKWFYYASVLSTLILLLNFSLNFIFREKSIIDLIFHDFTLLYDQHPVYFSMFLTLALFYDLVILKSHNKLRVFFNLILIVGIILCASKIVIFVNLIAYLVFTFYQTDKLGERFLYLISFIIIVVGIFNVSFIKERFSDGLRFRSEIKDFKPTNDFSQKKIFDYEDKTKISDLELRYILGAIGTYHLIKDKKLFIGYGQGDVQSYLDYYYYSYNLGPNWNEGRNVHNQFLHVLITYGIFTLLLFLSYIIFSLYIAIKHKDALYLFFLVMTLIVFIFEVVLIRNKGIIFFYFFNSLFLFKNINFENRNNRH